MTDEENEDGWPTGAIGDLIDGYLRLASDVGRHDLATDELVWAARTAYDDIRAQLDDATIARQAAQAETARMSAALDEERARVRRWRPHLERIISADPCAYDDDWHRQVRVDLDAPPNERMWTEAGSIACPAATAAIITPMRAYSVGYHTTTHGLDPEAQAGSVDRIMAEAKVTSAPPGRPSPQKERHWEGKRRRRDK